MHKGGSLWQAHRSVASTRCARRSPVAHCCFVHKRASHHLADTRHVCPTTPASPSSATPASSNNATIRHAMAHCTPLLLLLLVHLPGVSRTLRLPRVLGSPPKPCHRPKAGTPEQSHPGTRPRSPARGAGRCCRRCVAVRTSRRPRPTTRWGRWRGRPPGRTCAAGAGQEDGRIELWRCVWLAVAAPQARPRVRAYYCAPCPWTHPRLGTATRAPTAAQECRSRNNIGGIGLTLPTVQNGAAHAHVFVRKGGGAEAAPAAEEPAPPDVSILEEG